MKELTKGVYLQREAELLENVYQLDPREALQKLRKLKREELVMLRRLMMGDKKLVKEKGWRWVSGMAKVLSKTIGVREDELSRWYWCGMTLGLWWCVKFNRDWSYEGELENVGETDLKDRHEAESESFVDRAIRLYEADHSLTFAQLAKLVGCSFSWLTKNERLRELRIKHEGEIKKGWKKGRKRRVNLETNEKEY